nr:cell wall integrity and stress response component 4-like isoform X2 [Danaus plexippus plexippus]
MLILTFVKNARHFLGPGCARPNFENGIQIPTSNGAWVTHFCLPGYKLVGSSVIYCNGRQWNATPPICIDSSEDSSPALSCDFEEPDLCGWTQDEMHDFDWTRFNKKTPSSFLLTGPSYDHTIGKNGSGYYMYIESTSRLKNDTARFMSPVYSQSLSEDGCFSFFYHMFGNTIGGLRVYQKPDKLPMAVLLNLSGSQRDQHILFEKWGNQGDQWYSSVSDLRNLGDNFQIIIEGIRGTSFTSDIAIDDVAILQGENCTAAKNRATTPSTAYMPESCQGRCMEPSTSLCGCTYSCLTDEDCCHDFFELCVFKQDLTTTTDDIVVANSSYDRPQKQKLIASPPDSTLSTTTSTTSTTTTTTTMKTTLTTRTTTTPKPTTTSTSTTTTTTTRKPTTVPKTTTTSKPATTRKPQTTTQKTTTITPKPIRPNKPKPIRPNKPEPPTPNKPTPTTIKTSIIPSTSTSTTTSTTTSSPSTSSVRVTPVLEHGISRTIENHNQYHEMVEKAKKEQKIEVRRLHNMSKEENQSSGWRVVLIILGTIICVAIVSWTVVVSRSARGRLAIARFRGRCSQDPEVRYLSTDVDDD